MNADQLRVVYGNKHTNKRFSYKTERRCINSLQLEVQLDG